MAEPILSVEGLRKRFGGMVVLDGVSLAVEHGRIHGIIGPNGAGKTTLFNVINGVYTASGGRVLLKGRPITNRRVTDIARRGLGRTFQVARVFNEMTLLDNMLVPAVPQRLPRRAAVRRRATCWRSPDSPAWSATLRPRSRADRRSCWSSCAPRWLSPTSSCSTSLSAGLIRP